MTHHTCFSQDLALEAVICRNAGEDSTPAELTLVKVADAIISARTSKPNAPVDVLAVLWQLNAAKRAVAA